jgi:plastocyanin
MTRHTHRRPPLLLAALPVLLIAVLAACGSSSGGSSSSSTTPPATSGAGGGSGAAQVTIANLAYSPGTVTVKVGATVTWTNNDSVVHNVQSTNGPGLSAATTSTFASKILNPGQSFSFTFTKAGTYHYECTIHKTLPAMHAVVVVK